MDNEYFRDWVIGVLSPLCDSPEKLKIKEEYDDRGVLLTVYAVRKDLSRIIGKEGNTVKAVRTLLKHIATKNQLHFSLKVDDLNNYVY